MMFSVGYVTRSLMEVKHMTDDNIVRSMYGHHKGPWKGPGPGHDQDENFKLAGAEFENIVLGMKQMLDSDLAQKA